MGEYLKSTAYSISCLLVVCQSGDSLTLPSLIEDYLLEWY